MAMSGDQAWCRCCGETLELHTVTRTQEHVPKERASDAEIRICVDGMYGQTDEEMYRLSSS